MAFLGAMKAEKGTLTLRERSFEFTGRKNTIASGAVKGVSEEDIGGAKVVKVQYATESETSTVVFSTSEIPNEDLAAALYPLVDIGDEARGILERVAKASPEGPVARAGIEEAVGRYFQALGLAPRPIRWIERETWQESCAAGFTEVWSKGLKVGLSLEEETRAERDAENAVKRVRKSVEKVAHAAGYIGLSQLRPSYKMVNQALQQAREERRARDKIGERIEDVEAGLGYVFGFVGGFVSGLLGANRSKDVRGMQVYSALAASKAVTAGFWAAVRWAGDEAGVRHPAVDRLVEISLPFVDAVDHGLWLYWITPDDVIAVARNPR